MKPTCFVLALTALGLSAGCVASHQDGVSARHTSSYALPYREPIGGWNLNVSRGDTRETVATLCGAPDLKIGDDIWVYWNTTAGEGGNETVGYNTLVMVFVGNCVDNMRLVNGDALRVGLASAAARGQPRR